MSRKAMDRDLQAPEAYPPVTDELLASIVKRVLSAGNPLKIVLFGSRARGNHRPEDLARWWFKRANQKIVMCRLAIDHENYYDPLPGPIDQLAQRGAARPAFPGCHRNRLHTLGALLARLGRRLRLAADQRFRDQKNNESDDEKVEPGAEKVSVLDGVDRHLAGRVR